MAFLAKPELPRGGFTQRSHPAEFEKTNPIGAKGEGKAFFAKQFCRDSRFCATNPISREPVVL